MRCGWSAADCKTKPGCPEWCQAPAGGKSRVWTKPRLHAGPDVNSSGVWFGTRPTSRAAALLCRSNFSEWNRSWVSRGPCSVQIMSMFGGARLPERSCGGCQSLWGSGLSGGSVWTPSRRHRPRYLCCVWSSCNKIQCFLSRFPNSRLSSRYNYYSVITVVLILPLHTSSCVLFIRISVSLRFVTVLRETAETAWVTAHRVCALAVFRFRKLRPALFRPFLFFWKRAVPLCTLSLYSQRRLRFLTGYHFPRENERI